MWRWQGHPEEVYGCEFVGGSGSLVSGSGESLFLWDVATGRRLCEAGPPGRADAQHGAG